MDELLNKKIKTIEFSETHDVIIFTTSKGEKVQYTTEGDCCSESWIAHLTGVKNLIGQHVDKIEEVDFSEEDQKKAEDEVEGADHLSLYGYKLLTDKGHCVLEFRNNSNGYYGGWLHNLTGGIDDTFKKITKDF